MNLQRQFGDDHRRHVVDDERLVAGWRELISRMEADGRDVTIARDLLKTFEDSLDARRSTRDPIRRAIGATASDPKTCRAGAIRCAKLAAETREPRLRERLADMAVSWTKLACELERRLILRDELGDRIAKKSE